MHPPIPSGKAVPTQEPRRVKVRFIAPLAVVLLFILGVFAVAILLVEIHVRDKDIAERTNAVEKLFAQKLEKDVTLMIATMRAMMTNEAVAQAFRDQDRNALTQQVPATYQAGKLVGQFIQNTINSAPPANHERRPSHSSHCTSASAYGANCPSTPKPDARRTNVGDGLGGTVGRALL
ncbi:MAG TPA: hypothetical protein VLQ47_05040, partial [Rhodoferax sp.]|nr:hypothetical protein [Rhodoferax sp.]